jgi:hypothetical protein
MGSVRVLKVYQLSYASSEQVMQSYTCHASWQVCASEELPLVSFKYA